MLSIQTLIDDLAAGCKPKDQFRMGLELERFAHRRDNGAPLRYEEEEGIRELLEEFSRENDWEEVVEDGQVIALKKGKAALTLEPGGQVEYAGPPVQTLAELRSHMDNFHRTLQKTARKLGIDFTACGFHPHWQRDDLKMMPKARYRIMRRYMPKKGAHGLDMMLRTCGTQLNLDYQNEADMVTKYRVMLAVQPLITALMANSRMAEGIESGYKSYRAHVWTDTDPDRCGFPEFVFDKDMGFALYVEKALDVPMYFIRRHGKYIDVAGQSFRDFMAGRLKGHEGLYPTLDDWHDHLTTIFWDVRLKHYLELRGPDSAPDVEVYAMAAFWAGILYDDKALGKAASFISKWPLSTYIDIHKNLPRDGLTTCVGGMEKLWEWGRPLLYIAEEGLDPPERAYLRPFYNKLDTFLVPLKSPTASGY